jgi:putative transcriptional regulator
MRFATLEAICDALDCQPGDLLGFEREDQDRAKQGEGLAA